MWRNMDSITRRSLASGVLSTIVFTMVALNMSGREGRWTFVSVASAVLAVATAIGLVIWVLRLHRDRQVPSQTTEGTADQR